MLRRVGVRALWLTRGAALFGGAVFGLALVLGLVFGVATMALGANGSNFILGQINNTATALTKLTANVQGPAMQVQNTNAGTDDAAIALSVQPGEAPMRVNSTGRVTNLNADKLDGQEPSQIKGAKAYAVVFPSQGPGNTPILYDEMTSGFTEVERVATGNYCLTAPGLDPNNRPPIVSVENFFTLEPAAADAMGSVDLVDCGFDRFQVVTERISVQAGSGAVSSSNANDVAFVVAVP